MCKRNSERVIFKIPFYLNVISNKQYARVKTEVFKIFWKKSIKDTNFKISFWNLQVHRYSTEESAFALRNPHLFVLGHFERFFERKINYIQPVVYTLCYGTNTWLRTAHTPLQNLLINLLSPVYSAPSLLFLA